MGECCTNITLKEMYRDVLSRIRQACGENVIITHTDAVNVINGVIRNLRVQYVKNGIVEDFLITDTIWASFKDFEYPFLYKGDICSPIMNEVPISVSVQSSVVWETDNELNDRKESWSKGDLAIKGDMAYKAIKDISSTNTFDGTFEIDNVRTYRPNNGLKFEKGDVVYNVSDSTYWMTTSDYKANQSQQISSTGSFKQLYWKGVEDAYKEASYVEFTKIHQMNLIENMDYYPFTIKNCTLYTTSKDVPITLTFIPKWEKITDLEEKFLLPDSLISRAKDRSIVKLAQKLGVEVNLNAQSKEG